MKTVTFVTKSGIRDTMNMKPHVTKRDIMSVVDTTNVLASLVNDTDIVVRVIWEGDWDHAG